MAESTLTLEERLIRLPTWARQYIDQLKNLARPAQDESRRLHQKLAAAEKALKTLGEKHEALHQFISCAAKGGHPDAKAYVESIFNEYGPVPSKSYQCLGCLQTRVIEEGDDLPSSDENCSHEWEPLIR